MNDPSHQSSNQHSLQNREDDILRDALEDFPSGSPLRSMLEGFLGGKSPTTKELFDLIISNELDIQNFPWESRSNEILLAKHVFLNKLCALLLMLIDQVNMGNYYDILLAKSKEKSGFIKICNDLYSAMLAANLQNATFPDEVISSQS